MTSPALEQDIAAVAAELESAPAVDIVRWGVERFGDGLVVLTSFQDAVLVDVAVQADPDVRIAFLDTQYHFPETWEYVDTVRERYPGLNLEVVTPEVEPDERWRTDIDGCCHVRKVEPLERVLADRSAWVTGVRRVDSPLRATTPVVTVDRRGKVKLNPLATWTDEQLAAYVAERDLPVHPLQPLGFLSIGCWPCTRAVRPGEDPREGRWSGTGKSECGLHL